MAYKMKGFSGFKSSPVKQEGPIPKQNLKLQKGEMEGTWIYPGSNEAERITDYEDRAEFSSNDAMNSEPDRKFNQKAKAYKFPKGKASKKQKQHLANSKNFKHEADIIRNRKPAKKKSPAKQKTTTIKQGKYKGHTKEVYKKGDEGWAGKGRGVVIKDKNNNVVETRGKAFKTTKKDKQQMKEINEMLRNENIKARKNNGI